MHAYLLILCALVFLGFLAGTAFIHPIFILYRQRRTRYPLHAHTTQKRLLDHAHAQYIRGNAYSSFDPPL